MTRAGPDTTGALEAAADERPGLVATLIRLTGDWELAEDCVQDAVERALERWPVDGVPERPAAWLTTVARRRALDVLRRRTTERAKLAERALLDETTAAPEPEDRLRLLFTCCHPALPVEGRVALTLRTVGGLTTGQVARAFLVSEATMSQRLLRTRRKITHAGIPYRVPPPELLAERLGGVLAVVYLVFNAGYGQADGALAREGLRLARLLTELMPTEDEARALHALLALQLSRHDARLDADGVPVPMEEQDRARWDDALVLEGLRQLRRADAAGRPPGPYRLQARIAALHAGAARPEDTDWAGVVASYDALLVAQPSPVVALNRAVAVGFRDGWEAGLAALDALGGDPALAGYYLLPAARADLCRRLGREDEARAAYDAALALVPDGDPAAVLLRRRRDGLDQAGRDPATNT